MLLALSNVRQVAVLDLPVFDMGWRSDSFLLRVLSIYLQTEGRISTQGDHDVPDKRNLSRSNSLVTS